MSIETDVATIKAQVQEIYRIVAENAELRKTDVTTIYGHVAKTAAMLNENHERLRKKVEGNGKPGIEQRVNQLWWAGMVVMGLMTGVVLPVGVTFIVGVLGLLWALLTGQIAIG